MSDVREMNVLCRVSVVVVPSGQFRRSSGQNQLHRHITKITTGQNENTRFQRSEQHMNSFFIFKLSARHHPSFQAEVVTAVHISKWPAQDQHLSSRRHRSDYLNVQLLHQKLCKHNCNRRSCRKPFNEINFLRKKTCKVYV